MPWHPGTPERHTISRRGLRDGDAHWWPGSAEFASDAAPLALTTTVHKVTSTTNAPPTTWRGARIAA